MFRFDQKKMNSKEAVGAGGFATVYPYGKDKVVKVIDCKNQEDLFHAMNEAVLGFNLDHPSVLPVEGYYIEKWKDRPHGWTVFLKLQRMETDLQKVINNANAINKYLKKEDIISYFYDIVSGLEYLNNKKIAHRDLKPSNLLLDSSGRMKISDIGLANFVPESSFDNPISRTCGTPKYKAPELQNRANHIKKKELFQADIWSLGMILLELCLLVPTFKPVDPNQTDKEKQDALNDDLERIDGILDEEEDEEGISKLLRKYLLNIKPSERMSVGEIKGYLEKNYRDILVQRCNKKDDFKPQVALSNNNNQFNIIENGQKQFQHEEEKVEIVSSQISRSETVDTLLSVSKEMQAQWQQYFTFEKEVQNELKIKPLLQQDEGEK